MRNTQAFRRLALLLAAAAIARPASATEMQSRHHILPEPAGLVRLDQPASPARFEQAPVLVILLPDTLGDEGRSEPYAAALAALGATTLVLAIEPPDGALTGAADATAIDLAHAWAAARFAPRRIALLGLGAGGRTALEARGGPLAGSISGPIVAVDPGCAGLRLPQYRPTLVVYGAAAPDAGLCEAMPEPPAAVLRPVPGLTHGWDVPPELAPGGALLPDPADPRGPRRRVQPDAQATARLAQEIAGWIVRQAQEPRP